MATKKASKEDRIDLDIVMGLVGNALLSDEGIQQIQNLAQQAKDPTGVLAQIVFQAIATTHDKIMERGMKVSSKIWVARGGVVDQAIAEVAKLIAGTTGNQDIINPNILEATREQVLDLLHEQEVNAGGPGRPNADVGQEDLFAQGTPDEEAAESPEEAFAEGDVAGMMPPGEAGGSHGPDRMPAPIGLLAGG